ncbi:jg6775, partial [Pararge aegeria aegeria]
TAPSRGDSGAGLAFPAETLGITRYYLQAITSTSPISRNGRIDLYAPTSFEPSAKHEKLIKEHWDPYL